MMTPDQISALKAAAEKATPGPWAYIFAGKNEMRKLRCADGSPVTPIASISHRVPGGLVSAVCAASIDGDFVRFSETSLSWPECDSEYIALANPAAILALIGEVERLTISHARYEKMRKMNVPQFADLFRANISSGVPFDELLDKWCGEVQP
jgi:hypothetical protein